MLKSMGGVPGGYCAGEGDNGGKLTTHMIGGGTAGVNAVKTRQDQCSSTRARWYTASACWIPRPPAFGTAVELDLPRSAVGINEYIYALSLRHPEAVRCA